MKKTNRFLIIHTLPYSLINYDRFIDHNQHDVIYIGYADLLLEIPAALSCQKMTIPDNASKYEVIAQHMAYSQSYEGIIALSEYDLLIAAKLRESFNIPGKKNRYGIFDH